MLLTALAATLLVYAQVIGFGHISWDDPEMVFANRDVQHFNLGAFFTSHYVGNYIPLTMVAHALAWAVTGELEWGHHLLGIGVHLLNGILVYRLTIALFSRTDVATFAAAVFLLHPVQVESVAWISEFKNVLFAAFFLGGLIRYAAYLNNPRVSVYLSVVALFVCSALSKPSAVVFPLAMICVEIVLRGGPLRLWKEKLPVFVLAGIIGAVTLYTQSEDRFINYAHAFPAAERIGYAGYALMRYAALFVAPVSLSVIYPYPPGEATTFIAGYLVLAILIAIAAWWTRKKKWLLLASMLFAFFQLLPVLQFIPFGEALYADRYAYLAVPGFCWMLAIPVTATGKGYRYITTTVLLALSVVTFARISKWSDARTLYEDILRKHPDNFVALNSAGVDAMRGDDHASAAKFFERAIVSNPKNHKGHYNLGLLFLKTGEHDAAIAQFNRSLALYEYDKAFTGRATAFLMRGDYPKAIADAEKAIAMNGRNAKAYFVLGSCYSEMNRLTEAQFALDQAIALDPYDADFYFRRGIVMGKLQRFDACANDLRMALRFRPQLYEAHYWLGVARVNLSQDPCPHFSIAARHNFQPAVNAYNKMCR